MKKHPIDTAWFLARLEKAGLSMHKLAPQMTGTGPSGRLDYSSLYRMLHGERAMSLLEAYELAQLLGVSLEDVAKRALGKKR